jgi:CheY-like chemotaxis protein
MCAEKHQALVVEDDDVVRGLVAEVLECCGCQVCEAKDGAEALRLLETSTRPDVIVLDLLMPGVHGWGFLEQYRTRTGGVEIPIVVLSVNPVLPRSFDRFGVVRCIGKPFQVKELMAAVEDAMAGAA